MFSDMSNENLANKNCKKGKSLMKIRKKIVPSQLPCGTPTFTG